jgi:hypothetical protein
MVGYQLGNTDNFQGTGVWSGVTLERTPTSTEETDAPQVQQQTAATGSKNQENPPTSATTKSGSYGK